MFCAVGGLLTLLAVGLSRRAIRLLDLAVPMLTFNTPYSNSDELYTLLSDNTALVLYQNPTWRAYVYQLPAASGTRNYRLEQLVNNFPDGARFPSASPDGQWLAWYSDGDRLIVSTDGTRHFTLAQPEKGALYWTQDSKQLVQLILSEPTGSVARCLVTNVANRQVAESFRVQGDLRHDIDPVSINSAHQTLIDADTAATSSNELDLEDIGSKTTTIQRYHYNLPSDLTAKAIVVSPDGGLICWLMESKDDPAWLGRLHRWLNSRRTGEAHEWSLWITNVSGGPAAEIGYIQGPDSDTALLSDIGWSPSGQHLAFRYNGKLWMVSVPQ